MTTRKRRPPKRQAGRVSRMIAGGAAMIGQAAMRNPVATGGTTAFAIVFSFVAANALWYQPSSHPHPWLDTRDAFRDYASKAMHPGGDTATTFRIERDASAQAGAQAGSTAAQPKPVDGVVVQDEPAPAANPLVADIQANLLRRGLYEGPVDGMMGSKTEAAIMFYQETRGLPQTGAADPAVLDLLKKDNAEFNVVPPDRPADVTGAIVARAPQKPVEKPAQKAADPVAALISKAPRPQAPAAQPAKAQTETAKVSRPAAAPPVPPAPIPNAAAKTPAAKGAQKSAEKPAQKPAHKPAEKAARDKLPAQKIVATNQRPAAIPAKAEVPGKSTSAATPSNLTMAIQKGLSNLAYRDVTVDGVPGEQTKEAIRHFQKHYRLPVTGEPDEAVLEKLKKIGAL
ncbi:peptidoglycan-binding domain-containing protein [Rhizobium sp. C4]|uniref:peptidoglycan-binding domain-containing protein n=1 Tax=Rhizobium sp. C4 TaxID=1349800 RepID=UPI001E5DB3F4|nr:peptidoglycan-binding domain-containing protein [Rhizobium sp. C4]MCD2175554.1 peptidoglycan-binding protein [Rhizobium sp. C4]